MANMTINDSSAGGAFSTLLGALLLIASVVLPASAQAEDLYAAYLPGRAASAMATMEVASTGRAAPSIASSGAHEWSVTSAAATETGKHRIASDVVVRGWQINDSVYFGHTRSRYGKNGIGLMVDQGETLYTLNHRGFTVSRQL